MNAIFQPLLAILSGFFLSLSIANPVFTQGFAPAAPFALVPLYIAFRRCSCYGEAMRTMAIQVLVVHLLSSYHLMFFRDFAVLTLGASALGTAGVGALFGALFFFPLHPAARSFLPLGKDNTAFYTLHFAFVYTLYDYFKAEGIGFLAYPWGTLPCAAGNFLLLSQTVDLAGVWGLSFMLSLFSAVVGEGIRLIPYIPRSFSCAAYIFLPPSDEHRVCALLSVARLCAALLIVSVIYGAVQWVQPRLPVKRLTSVVVQQNANPWTSDEELNIMESERLTRLALDALYDKGLNADVVVWSEGVLSRAFPQWEGRYYSFPSARPLSRFIMQTKVPFIIGGCAVSEDKENTSARHRNAALLFDADGHYRGYYGKLHLVPFAEVVPGVEYAWVRAFMKRVVGFSSGWAAGERYTYFDIPAHTAPAAVEVISASALHSDALATCTVRVAVPICFDDAFATVCRPLFLHGGEVFFNITDDSWSLTESAERQHLCLARYRAMEYRTTMLRATNSGVSAVIDPCGRTLKELPLFAAVSDAVEVPIYERTLTVYALLGDWLVYLIVILVALAAIFAMPQRTKH